MSTLQMRGDDDPPDDGISFNLHDEGSNYQSKLVTQPLVVHFRDQHIHSSQEEAETSEAFLGIDLGLFSISRIV